jgi:uncharacterized phage protein (TIGR01671 family)
MREIKFRAKNDLYGWVYGDYSRCVSKYKTGDTFHYIVLNFSDEYEVSEESIGQYTGLKDKDGREVYEGDIVKGRYCEYGKERRFIGKVKFISCCFKVEGVKQYSGMIRELTNNYEVIGNIHENKEMLGE